MYKCLLLQKYLKKVAKAATKINPAPSLSVICKLIDDGLRSRGLRVLSDSASFVFGSLAMV